jgi:hypothetical protein
MSAGFVGLSALAAGAFGLDADVVPVRDRRAGGGGVNLFPSGLATLSADGKGFGAFVFFGIVFLIPNSMLD